MILKPRCSPGRSRIGQPHQTARTPLITPTPNLYLPRPLRHIDPTRSGTHGLGESHTHTLTREARTHNGKVVRIVSAAYSSDEHVSLVGDCCQEGLIWLTYGGSVGRWEVIVWECHLRSCMQNVPDHLQGYQLIGKMYHL